MGSKQPKKPFARLSSVFTGLVYIRACDLIAASNDAGRQNLDNDTCLLILARFYFLKTTKY